MLLACAAALSWDVRHAAGGARGGSGSRKFIALVSGLGVGGVSGEPLAVALLVDWLTGLLGGPEDQAQAAQVPASAQAQVYSVAYTR